MKKLIKQIVSYVLCTQQRIKSSNYNFTDNKKYLGVVFSRNRPMQLYALLESINKRFTSMNYDIVVIYTCDSEYDNAYRIIEKEFGIYEFIKEDNFKKDLLNKLQGCENDRIFFLVDDMVITNDINLSLLNKYSLNKFVPSLRLGSNISYSYIQDRRLKVPKLLSLANDVFSWEYDMGDGYWGYPLSLDGHIFLRDEIIAMIKVLEFKAPNSLEKRLQLFNGLFSKRQGVAFRSSRVVNIPWNKVQLENDNKSGDVDSTYFLNKWNNGYKIDINYYENISIKSCHEILEVSLTRR